MTDQDSRPADEIAELLQLLPVPADRDLPAGHSQLLKENLMNAFHTARPSIPAGRPGRVPVASRRPKRRTVAAGAAASILAAATAATVMLVPAASRPVSPAGGGPAQHAATMQLLARIADAASRQPAPAPSGRPWEYLKIVERTHSDVTRKAGWIASRPGRGELVSYHTQLWRPVSDICRGFVVRTTPPLGPGSSSGTTPPSYGAAGEKCPSTGDLNRSTYRLLESLPTSPSRLLGLIYAEEKGHGPNPAQEAFTTIGDMLRDSIVPPQVSAALYRAAALIPGITVIPDAVNATGQHGVAVALSAQGVRQEWIFAKNTLRNIGQCTVEKGSVTDTTAIVDRAFVNQAGQIPPAGG